MISIHDFNSTRLSSTWTDVGINWIQLGSTPIDFYEVELTLDLDSNSIDWNWIWIEFSRRTGDDSSGNKSQQQCSNCQRKFVYKMNFAKHVTMCTSKDKAAVTTASSLAPSTSTVSASSQTATPRRILRTKSNAKAPIHNHWVIHLLFH